jgi:hypothetical protein
MPRLLCPSWRWITIGGTPSRAISTGCAWRSWCGAKRRRTPGAGPLAPTRRPGQNAEGRPNGQAGSQLEPGLELGPAPRVHADLAAAYALAAPHEQGTATGIEVGLGERERLVDAQSGAPQAHDQPAQPTPLRVVTGGAPDRDDLLDLGRIGRGARATSAAARSASRRIAERAPNRHRS